MITRRTFGKLGIGAVALAKSAAGQLQPTTSLLESADIRRVGLSPRSQHDH